MSSPERFWSFVLRGPPNECWPWQGARYGFGYGSYRWNGVTTTAHRVAWILSRGPVAADLVVRHVVCRNPPCCNPAHLAVGTQAENIEDKRRDGTLARGDRNGSRLHPERLLRGERAPMSKLTDAQVAEIRARFAAGGVTRAALAAEYGVSFSTTGRIIAGQMRQRPAVGDWLDLAGERGGR